MFESREKLRDNLSFIMIDKERSSVKEFFMISYAFRKGGRHLRGPKET